MELKALADISERFIEHYEQFEVLVGDMCEDADASLWTEDMRFWFNHAVDKLVETKLETALNTKSDDGRYDGKAYGQKVEVKRNPKFYFTYLLNFLILFFANIIFFTNYANLSQLSLTQLFSGTQGVSLTLRIFERCLEKTKR